MLSLSMLVQAQPPIVGHWTFEPGEELVDLAGNFDDLVLKGAEVVDGQLDLGPGLWAVAPNYQGPEITEVTLVSWFSLDDLSVRAGSVLTLDRINSDVFNGIVYAERQEFRFMNGSSGFSRTNDFDPGFAETETGVLIKMLISHEDVDGEAHVRGYRNCDLIGEYTKGPLATWPTGDAEVFFGKRHGNVDGGPGDLDAHIEEARIYAGAIITPEECQIVTSVDSHDKLTTLWGEMKAK
jgi:hypothetical protein